MDAVEFLKRIEKIDRIIENKIAELEHFRDLTQRVTASYGGDRVQASMSQQKMADAVGRCVDIEREIAEAVETLQHDRREIMAVLERRTPSADRRGGGLRNGIPNGDPDEERGDRQRSADHRQECHLMTHA